MVYLSQQVIEHMKCWIDSRVTDTISLSELSSYFGYSPYYCSTKFHEMTGITIKSYWKQQRLERASQELKNSNLRILDIAIKYGYLSQESFTRAFVSRYGCTPKHYRMNA